MERVSTVGYYAIKQCLIGFITERGESRCSVCAVTMPNCSADKGLKAVPIRGVSESPPSWRSMCNLSHVCKITDEFRSTLDSVIAQSELWSQRSLRPNEKMTSLSG